MNKRKTEGPVNDIPPHERGRAVAEFEEKMTQSKPEKIIWSDVGIGYAAFEWLRREDEKQVAKWGIQKQSPFEWLAYLTEEVGELAKAILERVYREGTSEEIIKEAIQTATLALKIAIMVEESKKE